VLETVEEPLSGLYFHEATPEALAAAVQRAQQTAFDPHAIRQRALRFSRQRFRREIGQVVARALHERAPGANRVTERTSGLF
jgi:hypothetical protein